MDVQNVYTCFEDLQLNEIMSIYADSGIYLIMAAIDVVHSPTSRVEDSDAPGFLAFTPRKLHNASKGTHFPTIEETLDETLLSAIVTNFSDL